MKKVKKRVIIKLKPETIENILKHRIKAITLESIAQIYGLGSRQKVHQVIEEHRNEPRFKKLYEEIDKTFAYLNRDI